MRVAIPVWEDRISPVFDAARTFLVADIADGRVTSRRLLLRGSERQEEVVRLLLEAGIETVICGAISGEPARLLEDRGIRLIPFIAGMAEQVLDRYVDGTSITRFRMPGIRSRKTEDRRQKTRRRICQDKMEQGHKDLSAAEDGFADGRYRRAARTQESAVEEHAGIRSQKSEDRGQKTAKTRRRKCQDKMEHHSAAEAGGAVAEITLKTDEPVASSGKPVKILLAAADDERFTPLVWGLATCTAIQLLKATTGAEVMKLLADGEAEIVIMDEKLHDSSGMALARLVSEKHPFVSAALVSSLPAAAFHEETEGLGILMQLPNSPALEDGARLMKQYTAIRSLWTAQGHSAGGEARP